MVSNRLFRVLQIHDLPGILQAQIVLLFDVLSTYRDGAYVLYKQQRHRHPCIPYFFSYKTEICSSQNNHKNLDLSYKMDLDLWDGLGRVKLVLKQNFIGLSYL